MPTRADFSSQLHVRAGGSPYSPRFKGSKEPKSRRRTAFPPATVLAPNAAALSPRSDDYGVLWTAKLADFGISEQFPAGDAPREWIATGTPYYMAPETLGNAPYSLVPTDVWAVGVMLYTLAHKNQTPWEPCNSNAALYRKILTPGLSARVPWTRGAKGKDGVLWQKLHELYKRMTVQAPEARPSAIDVCNTLKQALTSRLDAHRT